MASISQVEVKDFLVDYLLKIAQEKSIEIKTIDDDFDMFAVGLIDSLGMLEVITALEDKFSVELDMASLDAELLTVVGPLSSYVASYVNKQNQEAKNTY
jgi:acyl carrier protein